MPASGDKALELELPMKPILLFSLLFCVIAMPAIGALSDADLDKIRLIVNESEKRLKEDVKKEIAASEKRMKESISQEIKTVNAKIEGNDDQLSQLFWLVIALTAFIGLPQAIIAWRSRKDRPLEKQIETLTQEIETIKQQRVVQP